MNTIESFESMTKDLIQRHHFKLKTRFMISRMTVLILCYKFYLSNYNIHPNLRLMYLVDQMFVLPMQYNAIGWIWFFFYNLGVKVMSSWFSGRLTFVSKFGRTDTKNKEGKNRERISEHVYKGILHFWIPTYIMF